MLCNAILTNRYINLYDNIFVLGGSFTSPLTFILGDIIAELFGYRITKHIIWCGFACQTFFVIVCKIVVNVPSPDFWQDQAAYSLIFDQLLYINMSTFVAFIISSLINAQLLTKWKILVGGRYFWLRSLGSSTFAEAIYSAIAIIMMEISLVPLGDVIHVILLSYLIKVCYSIIFAAPTNALVNNIKKTANIDVYDAKVTYNPFKKFKST